jgi:vacuolar-type H+-ATPase subunit E/Vma4
VLGEVETVPLADLLEVLRRDADARATAIVATAREAAERTVAEAEARFAHRLAEAVEVREAELRRATGVEVESARREAMRDTLCARAEALAKIFARVRTLLVQRAVDPALEPYWAEAVADARTYIPSGDAVVQRPPDVAGITVTARDGSIRVDGTIEALFARFESRLAIEIARQLESRS